jgi:DNA helicase-2/ATP-dependent DNA helicase PcrA
MSTATPPPDPNFQEDDISNLSAGMKIQHQRFGFGEVLSVDGADDQRKAIIKFDAYGEKTLVLKFAKMRIVSGA